MSKAPTGSAPLRDSIGSSIWWLAVLGGGLQLVGTAVLFLGLRSDRIAKKATQIQIYIGQVDEQIEDLENQPKRRGMMTREGIDMGEAFDIMEQAAKLANRTNRKQHRYLLDEVLTEAAKHRRAQLAAIVLVLLREDLQILSAVGHRAAARRSRNLR
jgi:hypothetical protein